MKLKFLVFFLIAILQLSIFSNCLQFRSKSKSFLNSKSSKEQSIFSYEKSIQNSDNSQPPQKEENESEKVQVNSKQPLIKQGWLKISSKDLQNEEKQPKIPVKNEQNENELQKPESEQIKKENNNGEQSGQQNFRKNPQYGQDQSIPNDTSFWFRLSGSNLYYTTTEKDMNVLGAIAVKNVVSLDQSQLGDHCFKVSNQEKDQWELCADTASEKESWECGLDKAMGKECKKEKPTTPGVIHDKEIQKQPIILIPLPSPYCNENFNYQSHGTDWNCKCKEGFQQSPVDIQFSCSRRPNHLSLNQSAVFQWKKVYFHQVSLVFEDSILKIKCKGDDEDCRDFSMGSIVDTDLGEFQAIEIQFHTPSDHTLQGQQYPLEIQVIYKPMSAGFLKEKAAVSFLADRQAGVRNKFFENWDLLELPNILEQEGKFPQQDQQFSIEDLFSWTDREDGYKGGFGYAFYEGSLTSPPCDEHVRWFVVDDTVLVGMTTIEMIRDSIINIPKNVNDNVEMEAETISKSPDGNNRNIQPLNGRNIFHYDFDNGECGHQKSQNDKGHFEKVEVKADTYIYVPGEKPSGIVNSQIVTREEALGKQSLDKNKLGHNQ